MGTTLNPIRNRLHEAQYSFYKDKIDEETFKILNSINTKYSVWVIDRWLKLPSSSQATYLRPTVYNEQLVENLDKYSKLFQYNYFKDRPEDKGPPCPPADKKYQNIDNFSSFYELNGFLNEYLPAGKFLDWYKFKDYKKHVKITPIYEDKDWEIVHPDNHSACLYLGSTETGDEETDWCVSELAERSKTRYDSYTKAGCPIIYLKYKPTGERWLLGGTEDFVTDADDYDIDDARHERENKQHNRAWMRTTLPHQAIEKLQNFTNNQFSDLISETKDGDDEEPGRSCDRCGASMDEQEGTWLEDVSEQWCDSCFNNHGFYCSHCETPYSDSCAGLDGPNGTYCNECSSEQYFECNDCGKVGDIDNLNTGDDDESYCENCIADHQEKECEDCGDSFSPDDLAKGDDGGLYCSDCLSYNKTMTRISHIPHLEREDGRIYLFPVYENTPPKAREEENIQEARRSNIHKKNRPANTDNKKIIYDAPVIIEFLSDEYGRYSEILEQYTKDPTAQAESLDDVPVDWATANGCIIYVPQDLQVKMDRYLRSMGIAITGDVNSSMLQYNNTWLDETVDKVLANEAQTNPSLQHQEGLWDYMITPDASRMSYERFVIGKHKFDKWTSTPNKYVDTYCYDLPEFSDVGVHYVVMINPQYQEVENKEPAGATLLKNEVDTPEQGWLHNNAKAGGVWESILNTRRIGRL